MGFLEENSWIGKHIALYKTDPAKAHDWNTADVGGTGILPTLLLTTKGRKTGKPFDNPLVYRKYGDSFVVVGSKGGSPDHPGWYKNILAHPDDVEIQVSVDHYAVRARTASGPEREKLWALMLEILPHYADMGKAQGITREFPVVVLEPK